MAECERCGDEVARRFTHRIRTETMTHRRSQHVCAACHPALPDSLEEDRSSDRVVADGGTLATDCPVCTGYTVPDGKSDVCVDCGWTNVR